MSRRHQPAFSVIIPAYNRAHTLRRAIDSVLAQTFEDFELIIVDDGSTDGTRALVEAVDDPRIRYFYQENTGVSSARNVGAGAARGEFLTFLDSDDTAMPEWLESHRCAYSTVDVVLVCSAYLDFEKDTIHPPKPLGPLFRNQTGQFLAGTFSARRWLFIQVAGYIETLHQGENWELGMRLVRACQDGNFQIKAITEPLVVYNRQHMRSRTKSINRAKHRLETVEYLLRTYDSLFAGAPDWKARYLSISGVNSARIGSYAMARKYFAEAIRTQPYDLKQYVRYLIAYSPHLARRIWLKSHEDA